MYIHNIMYKRKYGTHPTRTRSITSLCEGIINPCKILRPGPIISEVSENNSLGGNARTLLDTNLILFVMIIIIIKLSFMFSTKKQISHLLRTMNRIAVIFCECLIYIFY